MKSKIINKLATRYPQNFILKNPLLGSLLFLFICLVFLVIYKPLETHGSRSFSYPVTMAFYFLASALCAFLLIRLIKALPYFSDKYEWNVSKEFLSVILVLLGTGITIYLMGFLLEEPADRWNFATFFDSCKAAFLIGIIPFGFFSLINYRYLLYKEVTRNFKPESTTDKPDASGNLIHINSRLKKEELSFYPNQLLFIESEGNYVVFHLVSDGQCRKEVIRNSMNDIEQQLVSVGYFLRVHRAFLVNMKKIRLKKGNTLGYKLKLYGTETEIPVSRQRIGLFDQLMNDLQAGS
ncbi:MAG TPA: LytTR family DNA-binding domain-containing protein [Bacteroidales bacterium]|nr:LytTR family DNA-binding domain-containing protein [Bacteroidales bacterium]